MLEGGLVGSHWCSCWRMVIVLEVIGRLLAEVEFMNLFRLVLGFKFVFGLLFLVGLLPVMGTRVRGVCGLVEGVGSWQGSR